MLIAFVRQQQYTKATLCYVMCTLPVLFYLFFLRFRKSVSSCKSLQDTQNIRYKYLQGLFGTFLDWGMRIEWGRKIFSGNRMEIICTNSRCLTKTQTRFGALFLHLRGVPSQLLPLQHVKWFQTSVGPCAGEMQFSVTMHDF